MAERTLGAAVGVETLDQQATTADRSGAPDHDDLSVRLNRDGPADRAREGRSGSSDPARARDYRTRSPGAPEEVNRATSRLLPPVCPTARTFPSLCAAVPNNRVPAPIWASSRCQSSSRASRARPREPRPPGPRSRSAPRRAPSTARDRGMRRDRCPCRCGATHRLPYSISSRFASSVHTRPGRPDSTRAHRSSLAGW